MKPVGLEEEGGV
ncbi:hypothetical protein HaLaN_26161, partial [Haematococcus lacustris]